jgi:hypothetical protein
MAKEDLTIRALRSLKKFLFPKPKRKKKTKKK